MPRMPWGRADDRRGRLRDARPVLKGPSADAQRGYVNLGKLIQCQGLLIPWYLEDRDCDYLHAPRLVAAPAANAVNPSSSLESFAVPSVSAWFRLQGVYLLGLTVVRVRYAVIQ